MIRVRYYKRRWTAIASSTSSPWPRRQHVGWAAERLGVSQPPLSEQMRRLETADQSIQLARRAGRGEGGALQIGFIGSAPCDILPGILGASAGAARGWRWSTMSAAATSSCPR